MNFFDRTGLPKNLFWGFLGVLIFMMGDGIEQTWLSKYIESQGLDHELLFTVYGISIAISSWLSGVIAETIGEWCSRNTFGIGTFYLLFLLFISGSMLTFKGPKIKIITICKYCLVFLIWTPLFLATILPNNEVCETIYGLVGTKIYLMLKKTMILFMWIFLIVRWISLIMQIF